jgi:hypothetical protein
MQANERQIHFQDDAGGTVDAPVDAALGQALALAVHIAQRHERAGSEPPLSFSSLLLGLRSVADEAARWLYGHTGHERFAEAMRAKGFGHGLAPTPPERARSSTSVHTTDSATAVLTSANALRITSGSGASLGLRHAIASYLWLPPHLHAEDLDDFGLNRVDLRAEFIALCQRLHPDEAAFWNTLSPERQAEEAGNPPPAEGATAPTPTAPPWLTAAPSLYVSRFDADAYTERDLLGIDRDVDALAALIALKDMRPPLSIGLFGEWGSGKSFFMRHLRRRIDGICAGPPAGGVHRFHRRIVHIEFNTWH